MGEGGGCRSDGSGRERRSNSSSRGGHGAGHGGRGPQPGLQAAKRLGKAGPGAGGAAPLRLTAGPLCGPERAGAAAEAQPRPLGCAGQAWLKVRVGHGGGRRDGPGSFAAPACWDKSAPQPGNSPRFFFPPPAAVRVLVAGSFKAVSVFFSPPCQ